METYSACPQVDLLERYASGRTSDVEAQRLEEHLRSCPSCLARLATLGEGDGLVQSLRAQKDKQRPESAILDRLQEFLRDLGPIGTTALAAETNSRGLGITPLSGGSPAADEDLSSLLAPAQRPDEIGRLGPYRVLRVLGAGGMGVVFEAEDPQLQRRIALKAIRPALAASSASRQRFLREAQRMAALNHDHILAIHHVGEDRGIHFLVMPSLQGESLEQRLKREGRLSLAEVLPIGRETAQGLAAAHERGVIHRDVKPPNLWLETPSGRVKILDFGLARLAEGDMALTGSLAIVGTPMYMAPEQAEGEADYRADLFSLGCVLYRLITGRLAFKGKTLAATLRAIQSLNPTPPRQINPEIPEPLSRLIERMLSKNRADRPSSAAAVARELEEIEKALAAESRGQKEDGAGSSGGRPSDHLKPVESPETRCVASAARRQRWLRLSVGGLLLAGVLAVAALVLWRGPARRTDLAPASDKLQILSLSVEYYPTVKGHRDLRPRLLGRDSFVTYCNDGVEVEARLSRPAFAFLIAFRPDGTEALCFPVDPEKAPLQTDRFRFPPASMQSDYGLEEGAGLQAFALVASSQPLPSFREWWSRQGCPWQRSETPPGVVWRTLDGMEIDGVTADPSDPRGTREIAGQAPVARLTSWLKKHPQVEAVAAVGFAVLPRGEP